MERLLILVGRQTVEVNCPPEMAATLRDIYGEKTSPDEKAHHSVTAEPEAGGEAGTFEVHDSLGALKLAVPSSEVAFALLESLTRIGAQEEAPVLTLQADLLGREEQPILVADSGVSGRVLTTAWFAGRGLRFFGSDLVVYDQETERLQAGQGALILDEWSAQNRYRLPELTRAVMSGSETRKLATIPTCRSKLQGAPALILFPYFEEGTELTVSVMTSTQAALALGRCVSNTGKLDDGGFDQVTAIAEITPALSFHYGAPEQLQRIEEVIAAILDSGLNGQRLRELATVFSAIGATTRREPTASPAPTPKLTKKRLTIGLASYDDYDGVYFTLQSLRLHHAELVEDAELIVVDNNPTGPCAEALKRFEAATPNFRYVPFDESVGTAASRDRIFAEASGDIVLVLDCHVLLAPEAITRLDRHFRDEPETMDLLQGPMVRNPLTEVSTHWDPVWRRGMFGTWGQDPRGRDLGASPFDIPMQGMGLFACRRSVWPGFNPRFRGFGGEEGYIHEKFRQNGGRTLCLPFLKWLHRFERPMGVPYPLIWEDRIRNYLIGFTELGLPTDPVVEHFNELLGEQITREVVNAVGLELAEQRTTEVVGLL